MTDGCTAVWASVMSLAIADMDNKLMSARRAARHWMYSERRDDPGSFLWVCDALDLDPHRMRQHCLTRAGRKQLRTRNVGKRSRLIVEDYA